MHSSTEPDTLRPVVHLGTFERVVGQSQPEEQEVDYEVMGRDYVKMARWDYRSGNRAPSQASSVPWIKLLRAREQPRHPVEYTQESNPGLG
uniref:Uncharacterized protein n=1 Tax=Peronospora matthiolae TaxID=2874970 RepID=A0AAV1UVV3_9STRA